MGDPKGFLTYQRQEYPHRPVDERLDDYGELKQHLSEEEIRTQAARCMNCGVPYCQGGILLRGMVSGCPLHNLIPEWNDLVYKGLWHEAYRRLSRTSAFPEFTARVCPAPCEGSCTEGLHMDAVTICQIEYEIIERAFAEGWVKESTVCRPATGLKTAVIGSGPAGLAVAYDLRRFGHQVTVFERQEEPGGLLMYGIPNMKLAKAILRRRLALLEEMGIVFKNNFPIETEAQAADLLQEYDAIILAGGATKPRDLRVPGREFEGIHFAVDYLKQATQAYEKQNTPAEIYHAKDKAVVVIGGGDTGNDCVGTALRQGAKSVVQLEIMPEPPLTRLPEQNPWPEWPRKVKTDYGQEEAAETFGEDPRRYCISTVQANSEDGSRVSSLSVEEVRWESPNGGRPIPVAVEGSREEIEADLVLIAMGFLGPDDKLCQAFGVNRDLRSNVQADFSDFKTSREKVFSCGDMRRGQSLVVWAMQEGKKTAEAVHHYLEGLSD